MSSEKSKSRRRFKTIGFRLTVWGSGVMLVVCALLCAILYTGMYYSMLREVDGFLRGEVAELSAKIMEHPGDYDAAQRAIRSELSNRARSDLSFCLFDAEGHVVITSNPNDPVAGHPMLLAHWDQLPHQPHYRTVRVPGQPHPYRTCSEPIETQEGVVVLAQAAYSLEYMNHSLALLRRISGVALVLVTSVACLGAWVLARRSLRPIDAMTVKARQIGADELTERLPRSGTDDELDRLAGTLNEMLGRIEDHVGHVRQFTADASHELRSPLAALRGMAEVALSRPRSADELREVVEASIEQYRRLQRLAEDLLLLTQADVNRATLKRERVRLDQVVRDAVELYAPLAEEAGLKLTVHPLPCVELSGDGGRLRQMVGNLIDNAVKYNKSAGEIDVVLDCQDGAADMKVRDRGIGIASEDLPYVFDRFYRGDKARTSNGAGLGLAICRWIAQAHGGEIELNSVLGEGTTASVRLPVSPSASA